MSTAQGACLCGAVRFEVDWPSKWVAHCHCTLCRRAHGAAFVTWFGMDATRARIVDDQAQLRWFASSPGAERGFCARCGSSLLFRSERWPGELHIALANLDDDADRAPMAHVFWDTRMCSGKPTSPGPMSTRQTACRARTRRAERGIPPAASATQRTAEAGRAGRRVRRWCKRSSNGDTVERGH